MIGAAVAEAVTGLLVLPFALSGRVFRRVMGAEETHPQRAYIRIVADELGFGFLGLGS